jgi:hypothetical protein
MHHKAVAYVQKNTYNLQCWEMRYILKWGFYLNLIITLEQYFHPMNEKVEAQVSKLVW